MSREEVAEIRAAVERAVIDWKACREHYLREGLSEARFLWDMLWASKLDISDMYRRGLNDVNIEAGLRKALPREET